MTAAGEIRRILPVAGSRDSIAKPAVSNLSLIHISNATAVVLLVIVLLINGVSSLIAKRFEAVKE